MVDLRLWRILLLAAPLALVVAMFSLEDVPEPLAPALPPDAFEGAVAASLAKDLARQAPAPRPGSRSDEALAEAVLSRFKQIPGVQVSEQRFTGDYGGDEVDLRNLIAVLPGESDRQVALIAGRDVSEGSGAASSVASTAALLEIAGGFAGSTHEKTLVFVSTDGASIGALGARRFASDYSSADQLDAVIVLSQPASRDPAPPLIVPWSTGEQSANAKLVQSAEELVGEEADRPTGDEGPFADLSRLAIPSALGEQGPLIESGLPAVRVSSHGELPLPPAQDEESDVNAESLDRFGRGALSLMLALDSGRTPLESGPGTYIGLAGNLLPGWTLSMLALALMLPLFGVGLEGLARSASSPAAAARSLGWVALRGVPFLAPLAVVFLGGAVGLVPAPEFPFTPGAQSLGTGGTVAIAIAAMLFVVAAFLLRPLLAPPPALARTAPAAGVTMAGLVSLGVWVINPYLALLVALGAQLWVPASARIRPGRALAAALVLAGLLPCAAAVAELAGRFEAGAGVVWDLLYMLTGGQLGYGLALLGCLYLGTGLAVVAAAADARPGKEPPSLRALVERGRELEAGRRRPQEEEPPPPAEPPAPGPEEPPPPEEPRPDPRMWSKPPGSSSRPSRASTYRPSPSRTRPIWVRP